MAPHMRPCATIDAGDGDVSSAWPAAASARRRGGVIGEAQRTDGDGIEPCAVPLEQRDQRPSSAARAR